MNTYVMWLSGLHTMRRRVRVRLGLIPFRIKTSYPFQLNTHDGQERCQNSIRIW